MTDAVIDPESFLSPTQRLAMQVSKQCWHKILAEGGIEVEAAIAMFGQGLQGLCGFDKFTAGRVAVQLFNRASEALWEVAIADAKEAGLPFDALIESRDKAIADRIAAEEPAPAERPKPTLVPDPAND